MARLFVGHFEDFGCVLKISKLLKRKFELGRASFTFNSKCGYLTTSYRGRTTSTSMMRIVNQTSEVRAVSLYFGHLSVRGSRPCVSQYVASSSYHTYHPAQSSVAQVYAHCTLVTSNIPKPPARFYHHFIFVKVKLLHSDWWVLKRPKCSVITSRDGDSDSDERIPWNWTTLYLYFKNFTFNRLLILMIIMLLWLWLRY